MRLHGKISARLAGIPARTAIPGSLLSGLARLSCNREVDFCCVDQTCRDPAGKLTPVRLTGPARLMQSGLELVYVEIV